MAVQSRGRRLPAPGVRRHRRLPGAPGNGRTTVSAVLALIAVIGVLGSIAGFASRAFTAVEAVAIVLMVVLAARIDPRRRRVGAWAEREPDGGESALAETERAIDPAQRPVITVSSSE